MLGIFSLQSMATDTKPVKVDMVALKISKAPEVKGTIVNAGFSKFGTEKFSKQKYNFIFYYTVDSYTIYQSGNNWCRSNYTTTYKEDWGEIFFVQRVETSISCWAQSGNL